jgi:transcriptional regulator with XRE-family HTH domain
LRLDLDRDQAAAKSVSVSLKTAVSLEIGAILRERRKAAGVKLRELSARVGLSIAFLSEVERGKKALDPKHYGALAAAIPGWAEAVRGPPSAPPPPAAAPVEPTDDARQIAIDTLTALRGRLATCPPSDIHKVATAITAATRLLARLSGQLEVSEAQLLRSAAWAKAYTLLERTLERFPDAARAVAEAFEDFGSDS